MSEEHSLGTVIKLRREQLKKYRAMTGLTEDTALAAHMGVDRHTVGRATKLGTALSAGVIAKLLAAFPFLDFEDLFEVIDEPEQGQS